MAHRILVVADEEPVATDLTQGLSTHGYEVVAVCADGADAVRRERALRPDLVLMDIVLKGDMDGIQAARRIRELGGAPVVFVTGRGDDGLLELARTAQPAGYLEKPCSPGELHAVLALTLARVQAEGEQRRRGWFHAALMGICDPVVGVGRRGEILLVNPAVVRFSGRRESALRGRPLTEILEVERKPGLGGLLERVLEERHGLMECPGILIGRDGRRIPVLLSVSPVIADTGETLGATCLLRDLSRFRSAERALRESELRFRTLAETATCAIIVYRDRFLYLNPASEVISGYSREELMQMSPADLVVPEQRAAVKQRIRARLRGDPVLNRTEVKIRRKDGAERWISVSSGQIEYAGTPAGIATIFDVTGHKHAEEDLRRYLRAMEGAMDGMAILDAGGAYVFVNEAHARLYGYGAPGELLGRSWEILYEGAELTRLRECILPGLRAAGRWCGEALGRRRDGSRFPQELSLTALEGGGLVCVVRDISERKREEADRRRREAGLRAQQKTLLELVSHESIGQGRWAEALRLVCESAARTLGVERVSVWCFDASRTRILCELQYERSMARFSGGMTHARADHPAYFAALESDLVIAASDAHRDPRTMEFSESYLSSGGAGAMLDAPIRVGSVTVAVLCHEHVGGTRDWTLEEQNFATALAEIVALVLGGQERRRTERELFREKELAQVTLESIGDGVIRTDVHGVIEYLNPVAEELTGWPGGEAVGRPILEVFRIVDEVSRRALPDPVRRSRREKASFCLTGRTTLLHRDQAREFAIEVTVSPIRDRDHAIIGTALVFRDVTELHVMARQMAYQATHDPLTGLINRREFERRLEQALTGARELGRRHALCYLDLDQFKIVNDTCGHAAGDELLRGLSVQLAACIRGTDILARLGGDEFGALLKNCSMERATQIADSLRRTVCEFRYRWREKTFVIGVSIGMLALDADTRGLFDALSAADSACYVAKDEGRNRIHVFEIGDSALVRHRGQMQWAQRIRQAINEDRWQLWLQPYRPLASAAHDTARPAEFLLRMVGEGGEIVPPREFLPAAERYHLMPEIDRWVVRAVFSAIEAGHPMVRDLTLCGINLSGQSLGDETLLGYVVERLEQGGIPAGRLCFEITETAAIANLSHAMRFMSVLREMGCRFALDDFGSGLSSFAYLKNLPVDYLKIDGTFVRDMVEDPIDHAMVEAINQIGHVMHMRTIAEFVEDEATLEALCLLGVDFAQGYVIARPVPLKPALQEFSSCCGTPL